MHAANLEETKAISTAAMLKMSDVAYRIPASKDFSLSWQSEMKSSAPNIGIIGAVERKKVSEETSSDATTPVQGSNARPVQAEIVDKPVHVSLSKSQESRAAEIAPKTVVGSETEVKDKPLDEAEARLPATPDKLSFSSLPKRTMANRELTATSPKKEKDVLAKSVHDATEKPTVSSGNDEVISPSSELRSQIEAMQTIATPIATVQNVAEVVFATITAKVGTRSSDRTPVKVAMKERDRPSAKETLTNTVIGPSSKPEKGQTIAASGSDSGSHTNLNASQSTANLPEQASNGTSGVAAQPLNLIHTSVTSAGTQLRSNVAISAEGVVAVHGPVVVTGPDQLDVSVFDGTHGWLRIRAELGTSGAVNASLTASATAHDAVRAVLPEMVSYLQSEAVSVSKIAVHRAADTSSTMNLVQAESRQNSDSQRHRGAGNDTPASQRCSSLASGDEVGTVSLEANAIPDEPPVGVSNLHLTGSNNWIEGNSVAWQLTALVTGNWRGSSGNWLNMSA